MNEQTKEILIILQEECAEVIVEISKCFRFGPDQMMEGTDVTNIQRLEKEIGDLQLMIDLLVNDNVGVTKEGIYKAKRSKKNKLKVYAPNINIK